MFDGDPPPEEALRTLSGLPDPSSVEGPLQSREELFDVLANERRAYTLWYLYAETDGHSTFDDLVDAVVRLERATTDVPPEHEREIAVSLHHVEIPKLARDGLVDYDHRSETVVYRGDTALERCFETLASEA